MNSAPCNNPVMCWRNEVMRDYIDRQGLVQQPGEAKALYIQRCKDHMRKLPPIGMQTDSARQAETERKRRMVQNFGPLMPAADISAVTARPDPTPANNATAQPDKPSGGPLARLAGQLCTNPAFREWLNLANENQAADHIRMMCSIASLAELDHEPQSAKLFHERIRRPFVELQYQAA